MYSLLGKETLAEEGVSNYESHVVVVVVVVFFLASVFCINHLGPRDVFFVSI